MSQIDAKDLDHSSEMRQYFESVRNILVQLHKKSRHEADTLTDRYFSLDVDPLERALVMHQDPEKFAEDLALGDGSST